MNTALVIVTAVECVLLITVLALYLISIASTLRTVARTLGLVTFGVRAIEKQTEPLGPVLRDVNAALQEVATLLGAPSERPLREEERTVEAVEHGPTREVSSGGS